CARCGLTVLQSIVSDPVLRGVAMPVRVLILTVALGCIILTGCQDRWRRPPQPYPPGSIAIPPQNIPDGPPMAPIPRADAPPVGKSEFLLPQDPAGKSRSEYRKTIPPR